jgi:hypothetical protein
MLCELIFYIGIVLQHAGLENPALRAGVLSIIAE